MKELPRSLSREVLFSTSSVSQGRGGDITLLCREALRESSNLGLEGFGRVTAAEKGNLNSLLLTKRFMLSSCTLHRQSLQQLPGVANLLWASQWKSTSLWTCSLEPLPAQQHRASSSLFPLQLLLLFMPSDSRSRNALLNIAQSFLFHYSWLHAQPKMQGKVSREQCDVKCPTILKIYCWRNCACIYF